MGWRHGRQRARRLVERLSEAVLDVLRGQTVDLTANRNGDEWSIIEDVTRIRLGAMSESCTEDPLGEGDQHLDPHHQAYYS